MFRREHYRRLEKQYGLYGSGALTSGSNPVESSEIVGEAR
jgi:hypothetical protein